MAQQQPNFAYWTKDGKQITLTQARDLLDTNDEILEQIRLRQKVKRTMKEVYFMHLPTGYKSPLIAERAVLDTLRQYRIAQYKLELYSKQRQEEENNQ